MGGENASGGAERTATSVIPDGTIRSGEDQLDGFKENWETLSKANFRTSTQKLQIGSEVGQTLDVGRFALSGKALDIMDADVEANANRVIAKMDRALDYVNARRADK